MSVLPDLQILALPRPGRISAFFQSRLRSLDIEHETVGQVLAAYGLALTAPSQNLPNTRRNRNLIVRTTGGKKVLKLYRQDWREETIRFEHSILHCLALLDFPAPRLLSTAAGASFMTIGRQRYAVFDFIEGTNYTASFLLRPHRLQLMTLAGRTLARLHRALAGFLPESHHHLGFRSYTGGRHHDLAWQARKVDELAGRSGELADPEARTLAGRLVEQRGFLLSELGRLDEALAGAALPRLIIHGDYGLHNLLFVGTQKATPVDFELARLEWRLSDLVSCLSKLRYGEGRHDFQSMRWFMTGYEAEYPIPEAEWRLFPQVWQYYRLMGAVQYWNSYFQTGGPARKLRSAAGSIAHAAWAQAHPAQILAIKPGYQPG